MRIVQLDFRRFDASKYAYPGGSLLPGKTPLLENARQIKL